jgi:hypothetical protein
MSETVVVTGASAGVGRAIKRLLECLPLPKLLGYLLN